MIHPGVHLKEEIDARGMKQSDLASQCFVSPQFISDVIKGRRDISTLLAIRLSAALGTSAEFWLVLQNAYDLEKVKESL